MDFVLTQPIKKFIDVSIIMLLEDGNTGMVKDILGKNIQFFRRNGLEIILVKEESIDDEWLRPFFDHHPQVVWKGISCTLENTGKALNAGIRSASNKYVMLLPVPVLFITDIIARVRLMVTIYANSFATCDGGVVMVERELLYRVGGLDESISGDSAIRSLMARLELFGLRRMHIPDAKVSGGYNFGRGEPSLARTVEVNPDGWGLLPVRIFYDWRKVDASRHLKRILERYVCHSLCNEETLHKGYRIIALMQVRNEEQYLPGVLLALDKICDGIILLDDGSEDASYERALSGKLIVKVKKKYKGHFDDLENRNMLLELGYLFKAEWYVFMDADDVPDSRYSDLNAITELRGFDTVTFRYAHLWDDPDLFRTDMPVGVDGIEKRFRMFRNRGFMQVISASEIHFRPVPYDIHSLDADVLILHSGFQQKATRVAKYNLYRQQDADGGKQGYKYDYLLDHPVERKPVQNIRMQDSMLPDPGQTPFQKENKMIILVPFYNTGMFLEECCSSLMEQRYESFQVVLLDDHSTDGSSFLIEDRLGSIVKRRSDRRKYALANLTAVLQERPFEDEDIVVIVHGDDYLLHNNVLRYLNDVYAENSCLLTYGQCCFSNGRIEFCQSLTEEASDYRQDEKLAPGHLRTFRYKLFRELLRQDQNMNILRDSSGELFRMAGSMALMYPLMDIAGKENICCLNKVLYVRRQHRNNEYAIGRSMRLSSQRQIRAKRPLERAF